MPINTPVMLAPISLEMEHMAELLAAEEPELLELIRHALQIKLECSVNTCEDTISRYERIYNQPAGGKSLEDRRAAIVFLINSRLLVTREYMEKLVSDVLSCRCRIEEHYSEYRFTIHIEGQNTVPSMEAAARYVRLLKPAHLQGTLRYTQVERGNIHVAAIPGIGHYLQVQPYVPEDIAGEGPVNVAVYVKGAQHLQILPEGE